MQDHIAAFIIVAALALGAQPAARWLQPKSDGIWADAAAKSPLKARPHMNYGLELMDKGRLADARGELSLVQVLPDDDRYDYHAGAAVNLSAMLLAERRYEEAIAVLESEGIRTGAMAANVGVAMLREGDFVGAEKYLLDAAARWPDSDAILANLAECRRAFNDCAGQKYWSDRAQRINPEYAMKQCS